MIQYEVICIQVSSLNLSWCLWPFLNEPESRHANDKNFQKYYNICEGWNSLSSDGVQILFRFREYAYVLNLMDMDCSISLLRLFYICRMWTLLDSRLSTKSVLIHMYVIWYLCSTSSLTTNLLRHTPKSVLISYHHIH